MRKVVLNDLSRRNVDGDPQLLGPLRCLLADFPQDERAYSNDGTTCFRGRNEICGRYETVLGMVPPEQGFEGADGARFCVDLRLKDDRQFSPIESRPMSRSIARRLCCSSCIFESNSA
jgi:hypothetical protein